MQSIADGEALAAVALGTEERPSTRAARDRTVAKAIKTVAAYLGNTPAVCRASYVDPRVIDRFQAGAEEVRPRRPRSGRGRRRTRAWS